MQKLSPHESIELRTPYCVLRTLLLPHSSTLHSVTAPAASLTARHLDLRGLTRRPRSRPASIPRFEKISAALLDMS